MIDFFKFLTMEYGQKSQIAFLPDIGTFFNQDIQCAKNLAFRLKKDGSLFIKGEILHDENIARESSYKETFLGTRGEIKKENNKKLISRKVLSLNQYKNIFEFCKKIGLELVMSVYDFKGAKFAKDNGVCALKIASSNINHQPLNKYVAVLGLPVIIDTGKSSFYEIARAIQWHEDSGNNKIIIEHSPAAPPAPLDQHHLNMISTLRKTFGYPVGLSDHHCTEEMLFAAVALGASVLEKGIVSTKDLDDQDVYHALSVENFKDVLKKCQNIKRALGLNLRNIPENAKKHPYRMGIIAKKNLEKGEKLSLKKVAFAFPKAGVGVENWEIIKSSKILKKVKKHQPINWYNLKIKQK